jgi:hypothetical protein
MSVTDIITSATRKLRPQKKHNTRSAIVVSVGIATAVWGAMKLKRELYGPGGTKLSRYDRSVDKIRRSED